MIVTNSVTLKAPINHERLIDKPTSKKVHTQPTDIYQNDTQHKRLNAALSIATFCIECTYAECLYAQ
jgi:hypothetical protein